MAIWHWLLIVTGTRIPPQGSAWYNFLSGSGSDIGEIVLIGALAGWYKRHKCSNCWRWAHYPVEGTHYKTCHKHSTHRHHARLRTLHAKKYPEQHEFLKGDN